MKTAATRGRREVAGRSAIECSANLGRDLGERCEEHSVNKFEASSMQNSVLRIRETYW
jgi:hypothetical protein